MKLIAILYFSAVGTTRLAAELLAGLLERDRAGGTACPTVALASVEDAQAAALAAGSDFLVFCYPTYYLKPARPMADFVSGLGPFEPAKPCYILTACELYSENSARRMARMLVARGLRPSGWKAIRAPGSDVTAVAPAWLVPWLYRYGRSFEARLAAAAAEIRAASDAEPPGDAPARLPAPRWYTPLTRLLQLALDRFDRVKHRLSASAERCTRCGLCAASCPAGAIALGPGGVVFDTERCFLCCRCIHACPARAIALGERLRDNRRIDRALLSELEARARAGLGLTPAGAGNSRHQREA